MTEDISTVNYKSFDFFDDNFFDKTSEFTRGIQKRVKISISSGEDNTQNNLEIHFELEKFGKRIAKYKEMFRSEIELFRQHMKEKNEEILDALTNVETAKRKLVEFKSYAQNKVGMNRKISKELRRTESKLNLENVLTDKKMNGLLDYHSSIAQLRKSQLRLTSKSSYIKRAIDEKRKKKETLRAYFETLLKEKDKLRSDLKKKLYNSKKDDSENQRLLEMLRKNEEEKKAIEKNFQREKTVMEKQLAQLESKYLQAIDKISEIKEELDRYKMEDGIKSKPTPKPYPLGEVTFVFLDIQDSTKYWDRDMESMADATLIFNEFVRKIIEKYKGFEVKTEGDSFFVSFDSPFDAMNFCLKVQTDLMELDWPDSIIRNRSGREKYDEYGNLIWKGLRVRIGLSTGTSFSILKDKHFEGKIDYIGLSVIKAARVCDASDGGEITIGETLYNEIKDHKEKMEYDMIIFPKGKFKLKGLSDPENIRSVFPRKLVSRKEDLEKKDKVFIPKVQSFEDFQKLEEMDRAKKIQDIVGEEKVPQTNLLGFNLHVHNTPTMLERPMKGNKDFLKNLVKEKEMIIKNKTKILESTEEELKKAKKKIKTLCNLRNESFDNSIGLAGDEVVKTVEMYLEILIEKIGFSKKLNKFYGRKVEKVIKEGKTSVKEISKERKAMNLNIKELENILRRFRVSFRGNVDDDEPLLSPDQKQSMREYLKKIRKENETFFKKHRISKKKSYKPSKIKAKARYLEVFKKKKKLKRIVSKTLVNEDEERPKTAGITRSRSRDKLKFIGRTRSKEKIMKKPRSETRLTKKPSFLKLSIPMITRTSSGISITQMEKL